MSGGFPCRCNPVFIYRPRDFVFAKLSRFNSKVQSDVKHLSCFLEPADDRIARRSSAPFQRFIVVFGVYLARRTISEGSASTVLLHVSCVFRDGSHLASRVVNERDHTDAYPSNQPTVRLSTSGRTIGIRIPAAGMRRWSSKSRREGKEVCSSNQDTLDFTFVR